MKDRCDTEAEVFWYGSSELILSRAKTTTENLPIPLITSRKCITFPVDVVRIIFCYFVLTGTWEALMSLGVSDHLHTAKPILIWSPLWVVVVVQRVGWFWFPSYPNKPSIKPPFNYIQTCTEFTKNIQGWKQFFGQAIEKNKRITIF